MKGSNKDKVIKELLKAANETREEIASLKRLGCRFDKQRREAKRAAEEATTALDRYRRMGFLQRLWWAITHKLPQCPIK